jgi:phage antirepressor YoqD-like protein
MRGGNHLDLVVIELRGKRVLTTAQLAEKYEATDRKIVDNFNNNKGRYEEGKHFILLQGEDLRKFKSKNENFGFAQNLNKLYLWTEKGAWLHAKSLNTDKAWEAYELLVDEYYRLSSTLTKEQLIKQFGLPANYKEALQHLAGYVEENEQLKQQIENDREKIVLANAITTSDEGLLIEGAAKYMRQNGVNIGRDRLFKWLRGQGYLVSRQGREYNMPTQKSLNQGLMKIHAQQYFDSEGELKVSRQVVVTGKGLMFFINKFLHDGQLTLRLE